MRPFFARGVPKSFSDNNCALSKREPQQCRSRLPWLPTNAQPKVNTVDDRRGGNLTAASGATGYASSHEPLLEADSEVYSKEASRDGTHSPPERRDSASAPEYSRQRELLVCF